MIKYSVLKCNDEHGFLEFFQKIEWNNFNKEQITKIQKHLSILDSNVSLVLEYPYVDQTFRDSYYEYYASKHIVYPRNCIRISIFHGEIDPTLPMEDSSFRENILENFSGYAIIRPTPNRPIGRSVISPKSLTHQNFICCLATFRIDFFGIKLSVNGFPHISQDQESITCAESSLWSIVQYYSHKYNEYNPLTPSKIRKILDDSASKRLIPSEGLTISQISFAMSKLGFGSMIYHNKNVKELDTILYSYIESGIPVIVGIENKSETFRHAVVCFGHEINNQKFDFRAYDSKFFDVANWDRDFIIMDDNQPPYNLMSVNDPGLNYKRKHKEPFNLSYIIVPLHKKIYLEYRLASKLAKSYLNQNSRLFQDKQNTLFRLFLTSSRSFKQSFFSRKLPKQVQILITRDSFPRFVWICEFGCYDDFLDDKISGFLIIDATGNESFDSVLFFILGDIIKVKDQETKVEILKADEKFSLYKNNLKGKWNNWEA